ncbi:MAG TPA: metallophosphoesterase [Steroidobacteraceae bacterium]|nr:metallophosphoesterase [Steroidobacteraceae bacterium]
MRVATVGALLLLVASGAWAAVEARITGAQRIVAFADVHGAYDELLSVLRETQVIDANLHWSAGSTHLVSTGDLLDRGPASRKVLDLLMRLEVEAREAGGAVHVVLGNHEVMNIVGDLRYVSAEEYAAFAGKEDDALREQAWTRLLSQEPAAVRSEFDAQFPRGYFAHRQAFSPTGQYGAWLLGKPFVLVVNDTAFVHGGLPPVVAELGLGANDKMLALLAKYANTWTALEQQFEIVRPPAFDQRSAVLAAKGAEGAEAQSKMLAELQEQLFASDTPMWYRGQALCYPLTEADNLDTALRALGVVRVVAGHTPSEDGKVHSRFDGKVILLDTGMLKSAYDGTPSALVFENGQWSVVYANRPGQRFQPEVPARAVGPRPAGLDDDALEQWLVDAEVLNVEDVDTGVTKPHKVTLRKDGIELRAVFKEVSTDETGAYDRGAAVNTSDRFQYELAAYQLDRLLGLDMVPVTVKRSIKNRRGVLQFWVDNSINVRRMLEQKKQPDGWCPVGPQYNLMNVFDVLTYNSDRTQENALFTQDWMLVLIDHTRAFRTLSGNPTLLYKGGVQVPASLAERLKRLDRETLKTRLGPSLQLRQIDALLKRRDRLLKEYAVPAAGAERVAR